jgi:outer membrane lipoprotein-sorting protein
MKCKQLRLLYSFDLLIGLVICLVIGQVVLLFVGVLPCSHAASLPAPIQAASESLLLKSGKDGSTLVKSMVAKTKQMKAYSFNSTLTTYRDGKEIVETGKLYFKKPNLLRFEVLKAGKRSGSVVVRQPDGKVRGKMGGALSGVKVTLSPDSKMLKTANDFSILESDLGSLLADASEQIGQKSCLAGRVPGVSSQVVELVASDGFVAARITVDSSSNLPQEWLIFKGNSLFSKVQFANLKELADLPNELFSLDAKKSPVDDDSVVLVAQERSANMSTQQYRSQIAQAKEPTTNCEALADELSKNTGLAPTVAKLLIAKRAAASLKQEAQLINAVVSVSDNKDCWAEGCRGKLVFAATQMELLLWALEPLGKTVGTSEQEALQLANLSKSIGDSRQSVSLLLDEIAKDSPSVDAIDLARSDLSKNIDRLETVCDKALIAL